VCGGDVYYEATAANAEASGYTVVQSDAAAGLAVCQGNPRCFVPVGYDWRLSAETNAVQVLQIINEVLSITGADRVDILAHSQGGLVAEAVTKMPQSVGKIYRIVTLGTPYLGAPKALSTLLYGTPCLDSQCALNMGVVQSLAENYPGLAELLPSEAYYSAYPQADSPLIGSSGGAASGGLTYDQAQQAIAGQLETLSYPASPRDASLVNAAMQVHQADDAWAPLDPTVGLLRMIGYDANDASPSCTTAPCDPAIYLAPQGDTITSVVEPSGSQSAEVVDGEGDGTVPLYSASLYNPATGFDDRGAGRDMYWCGLSHMGLAQDTSVWQSAEAYLEGQVSYATDVLGAACPGGGLGTIAGMNLVGAAASEPAGAVGPGPTSDTSCSPAATPTAPMHTSITIVNSSATDSLDLYWQGPGCRSELYATIPPQMQMTQSAYVGDMWRLESSSTGVVIGTISTTAANGTVVAS
jgi:pimeloyl-ACP methyl ester carboxylesterase